LYGGVFRQSGFILVLHRRLAIIIIVVVVVILILTNNTDINKSKVIWKKAESLLVFIRQVAAAMCNCMF